MYLLQAFLYHHEVSSTQEKCGSELSKSSEKTPDVLKLALSSAINRFLNLSSQIGEKRLGLR